MTPRACRRESIEEFWLWVGVWADGGVGVASGVVDATRGRAGVGSGWGAGVGEVGAEVEVWAGVGETSAEEARVREVGAGVEGAGAEITGDAEGG